MYSVPNIVCWGQIPKSEIVEALEGALECRGALHNESPLPTFVEDAYYELVEIFVEPKE